MFSIKQIMELAEIASLDISNCDIEELRAALNSNLVYVSQIKEVDVTDVEPLTEMGRES
jgi:aspartyl/glutamyl-tRNA(Asn/Gln) amidotransferase C subunit